jgi:hypothetical protein
MGRITGIALALALVAAGCAGADGSQDDPAIDQITVFTEITTAVAASANGLVSNPLAASTESVDAQADVPGLCKIGSATLEIVNGTRIYNLNQCEIAIHGGAATITGVLSFTPEADGVRIVIAEGTTFDIATDCFTGAVTVQTDEPLFLPNGQGRGPVLGSRNLRRRRQPRSRCRRRRRRRATLRPLS